MSFSSKDKIDLNDPKLTAFALGELEGEEEARMGQMIEKDPEAKKVVEEIRETAKMLTDELAAESEKSPLPRLSVSEREEILNATTPWWKSWRILYPIVGAVATAGLAAVVMRPLIEREMVYQRSKTAVLQQQALPPADGEEGAITGATSESISESINESTQPALTATVPSAPSAPPPEVALQDPNVLMKEEAPMAVADMAVSGAPSPMLGTTGAKGGASVARTKGRDASQIGLLSTFNKKDSRANGLERQAQPQQGLAQTEASNTEAYSHIQENDFKTVADQPLSTFSIDVDTASYANMRRFLVNSQLPPADSVRIEEMLNYFKYNYPAPKDGKPFSVTTETATAPWNSNHQLLRIGLKGRETSLENRPASNLVFLVDVSGSMDEPNKLPLLQKAFKLLAEQMRAKDHVAIVVYAGSSGVVLPSTTGAEKNKIIESLERLKAGGSTNGASGIQLAYDVAQKSFIKGGINRVILATDGDFNVGTTSEGELVRLIEDKAKSGVFLTVLGFGMGNYKDSTMQKLANKGNGNHAYIDSIREARKVLVQQAGGTLNTIAKDVKIQIEFNPNNVSAYRLIGYEKRLLANEDFNDDTKDAGEIGEGHTVTALYEIVPQGVMAPTLSKVDPLKYQPSSAPLAKVASDSKAESGGNSGELLTVKLRYKKPDGDVSDKIEVPVRTEKREFAAASGDMKFAASVAGFGMILRGSQHKGDLTLDQVISMAAPNTQVGILPNARMSGQADEYRTEFVELVKKAKSLKAK